MATTALAYAHGACAEPLRGETVGALLRRAAGRWPDGEALVAPAQGVRLSYRELEAAAERCARALLASGVQPGDRVGIWAPNVAEWVVVQYAAALAGAILVNVNPSYRQHELEHALRHAGCTVLVHAREFRGVDYEEALDASDLPQLRERVLLGRDWDAFLARADGVDPAALAAREATLGCDDACDIQYTSGTTGRPKGATLSHHNVVNNAWFVGRALGYGPDDRVCLPVPFYHCFGMVMGNLAAACHGACIVVPAEAFDADATLAAVEAERCTSLYGVPTMFIGLLEHPTSRTRELGSLRTGIMAGSPCPVEVMRRVRAELGVDEVTICYGMTETSPVSTQTARDDSVERRVTTVGRVHPHVEIKVVDPATGRTAPRGQPGELCTRGYSVMLGYWDDEAATDAAVDAARWMHTGDLAAMDDDGYVRIVGRIKDLIIRGGENISPREIEEVLLEHAEVADAQVFGVPDERLGEVVAAWVVAREGATLDPDELRAHVAARLARFKVPRHVRLVDGFPLTVTGKVQKFRMRETEVELLAAEGATTSAR